MNVQYISDSKGETTGVFIPIQDWNELIKKFKGIDQEDMTIPVWHKDILNKRLNEYQQNPEEVMVFDKVMDNIDNQL